MSILELDDMVKELGYTTPHNMYWKQPWGMLKITPLKTEIDVLSMLGCLPRNKYVHVYIEENVRQNDATENNSEPAWIDEDETFWFDDVDIIDSASDNQDSDYDSLLEDSDNDLADGDDEVCNVVVAVSRDIFGFSAGTRNDNEENESETESNGSNSLHSASDSETDCKKARWPEFNSETDLANPRFRKGLIFSDQSVIKAAVRQYGVLNRYSVKLKVNDSKRLQVICKEATYLEKWRIDPNYSPGSFQGDVRNDHFLEVPISKCSRVKKLALQMIHGNEDEQYERIYDYLGELRGTNPGTTTVCHLDNKLFAIMYVCLQAYKDGFKARCRPIISIDGCFLKGHYQEADLELTNSYHYTFMSDKQKGLIEEIGDLFPNTEHRTCVRHLYTNFKSNSGFQGKALKDALWKAARETYMKEFTDAMKEIRCWPRNAGNNRYEVPAGPADQHVVNLGAHTCSCRRWDLTAAILMRQERSETYVANCYSKHIQTMIYCHYVRPLRGSNKWTHLQTNDPILPPIIRRPVGRPQKNRRKETDEILTATEKMSKRGVIQMTCKKCRNIGHNRRSCKGPVGGNTHLPSNVNARVPKRKTTRGATSNVPQSTSTSNVSITHVPPAHRISKLDVRKLVSFNAAGLSKQNQLGNQHPQGSIKTSQHQAQTQEYPASKRPRWR
ncbi:hypothetical protein V6N13_017657 [Hibiscus sabdariffa]